MTSRGNWSREAGRLLKEIDIPDLNDHLDAVRDYLRELTNSLSKIANRQWRSTRDRVLDTAKETEETMRDNLGVSLVVALGVGVLIGYLIRRGTA
jgi:ElaB/YqjD/DUF883 family membrane-anchored ribosome-binding protein